ncbi:MAG TPA: hypothetical protein PLX06_08390, partial [Fimbriimonadaceae bacterium]|nr:hypothetical protein [Fimbriimonadaceae bacterium]
MPRVRGVGLVVALTPFGLGAWALARSAPGHTVDFNRDVMIPLKARCTSCHSGRNPAGGLDLSTPAGIQKGGVSGRAVIARNPGQ